jgi:hypothetical protein
MATPKANSQEKKETKAKSARKGKQSSASAKAVRPGRPTTLKRAPGENEIRAKAQEIYNDRLSRKEHGTAESDWLKAESLLKG